MWTCIYWEPLTDPLSVRERLSIASNPLVHAHECNLYTIHKGSLEIDGFWDDEKNKINPDNPVNIANIIAGFCTDDDIHTDSMTNIKGTEKMKSKYIIKSIEDEINKNNDGSISSTQKESSNLEEGENRINLDNQSNIVNIISDSCINDDILVHDVNITNIKGTDKMELKYIIKCIDDESRIIKNNNDFVIFSSNQNESSIKNNFKNEKDIIINQIPGVIVSVEIQNDKIPQIIKSFGCLINNDSSSKYYFFNADAAIAFMKKINIECSEVQNITLNIPEVPLSWLFYKKKKNFYRVKSIPLRVISYLRKMLQIWSDFWQAY